MGGLTHEGRMVISHCLFFNLILRRRTRHFLEKKNEFTCQISVKAVTCTFSESHTSCQKHQHQPTFVTHNMYVSTKMSHIGKYASYDCGENARKGVLEQQA
jgi:hypothetical protein